MIHAHHSWDTILARYHGAMRHQPARRQEQRGPRRIGPSTDQDLTRRELGAVRIQYHMYDPLGNAWRHWAAGDGCVSLICGSHSRVEEGSAIAEQQTWNLPAPHLALIGATTLLNQCSPISLRSVRKRLNLLEMEVKDVVETRQYSLCTQF